MKAEIRPAKPEDLVDLIEMGRAFFEESGNDAFTTFDEPSFVSTVIGVMSGAGTLLVAESCERAVGMAACVVFPFYANMNTRIGQEIFLYCKPDFRNGIGDTLFDELEAAAMRNGADVFIMANLAGPRDKAFARFYGRHGYSPAENTFLKRLSS